MRNVKVDKLICIHILKKERDMVDGDVAIGIEEPFGSIDESGNIVSCVRDFSPSDSMDDAMEAAQMIGLFERHALHFSDGYWHISLIGKDGYLSSYVRSENPAMVVSLACLKLNDIDVYNL